jgi:putative autotransporter adhesin-like protein
MSWEVRFYNWDCSLENAALSAVEGLRVFSNLLKTAPMFLYLGFFISCNSENVPDCFQNEGEIVRKEVAVPDFSKIIVFEKVALVLKQGDVQKVEIETGEFLIDEISASVEGDRLVLRNENGCNLFREYGLTTVYVTSPNISEIRSSTGLQILSDGALQYPNVILLSESFVEPEAETTDGEFDLELDSQNVSIITNGIAYFNLKGNTENLNINIAAGDSRIEAENLMANSISLDHRGTNDVQVNPQLSISGIIRGTGDVVSFNRPSQVDVNELYSGRLIFKN